MNAAGCDTRDDGRLAQAIDWFVRLRENDLTTEEIVAWLAWRGENGDNERAYARVQEMWRLAGDAGIVDWPDTEQVRADPYQGEVSVAQWHRQRQVAGSGRSPRGRRKWLVPATSVAAAVALAIALWPMRDAWMPASDSGVFRTQRGDTRTIRLADGSSMTLGGASTVRVAYHERGREANLERGEALFRVARDSARPFSVESRDLRVIAVGTAFTVRADDVRTVVAVTEGVVDIVPTGASSISMGAERRAASGVGLTAAGSTEALRARAGEQVTYDASRGVSAIQPSDAVAAIGWQDGALTSFDEPLRVVVARINRYSDREIVVAEAVADLRFTGTVFDDQVMEWAAGLERVFPVRVVEETDGTVRLEAR